MYNGLSIKDVRMRGLSSVGTFRTREEESSDADVRTFWCKKLQTFQIYGVSARKRGVEPVRTFCGQGEGQSFATLCKRLLWTALNTIA